jgi:hypothetical protein
VTEIARELNVRYQFAYNVCQKADLLGGGVTASPPTSSPAQTKPTLMASDLLAGGFEAAGRIGYTADGLMMPVLPKQAGVYAFCQDGVAHYVGVATRSLSQRLNGYARPGPTQTTNQRVNAMLCELIKGGASIDILCACPPDLEWNGFVISGSVGLEAGLILRHHLPWNIRGA